MCRFPSSLNKNLLSASLFTSFYDCGVIEGSFKPTKEPLSDLRKSRLLLNDVSVFYQGP